MLLTHKKKVGGFENAMPADGMIAAHSSERELRPIPFPRAALYRLHHLKCLRKGSQGLRPASFSTNAMTGSGQSRRFGDVCDMSALPPTTAVMMQCRERQKGANSGCEQSQQGSPLFDHLVGDGKHARRDGETERTGGMLITSSNLVGCITGRSAGFSPLRIRPA